MKTANWYRRKILETAARAGRGHLGGALGCIEILMAIHEVLDENDRFILSKGHSAIALYSLLFEDTNEFCKDGSVLTEHPSALIPKINLTTGSLGHGLGLACGFAWAKQLNNEPGRIYVLVGDGECMEGSVYEAITFAVMYNLDNLTIVIDLNGVMSTRDLPYIRYDRIFEASGCIVKQVDGHNLNELKEYLKKEYLGKSPYVIIAHTTKGKGVSFMEGKHEWHHGVPKGDLLEIARKDLSND